MFDLLFLILFDCAVEGSIDTRLPNGLRKFLLLIVSIVFFGCVVGLIWAGVEQMQTSAAGGTALILGGIGVFVFGILWYRSTMKKMKKAMEEAAQRSRMEDEPQNAEEDEPRDAEEDESKSAGQQ